MSEEKVIILSKESKYNAKMVGLDGGAVRITFMEKAEGCKLTTKDGMCEVDHIECDGYGTLCRHPLRRDE